jgi:hypothetical protein
VQRWVLASVTVVVVLSAVAQVAASNPVAVPELDGSALGAGVALLASGVLMYRARTGR